MTRARLILNPSSGAERAQGYVELLNRRLRERYAPLEIALTTGDGDAQAAAATAIQDGCSALFIGGGDGTLNEALNGVMAAGAFERVQLGVIPLGTGNDFAAALGIPADVEEALAVLLAADERRIDVGEVNGRGFVNISGGGFIAEVSQAVTPQLKTIAGRLAYLVGGAQVLFDYEPVRATVALEPGGERIGLGLHAFAVCNSRLIGGGRLIAPAAVIDDGLLDVCLIEAMSALEFVALLRKVADGEHIGDERVRYYRAARVQMSFDREVPINTDGEVLSVRSCTYGVRARAARFLTGASPFVSNA